ncbi:MAG: phosphate ABC transporter ATP-binding protein [Phycisphaerales bacterium]|nr:MAG: phosphate ABC transporter ATP-binding protein [Phycisphaerales bacterium]
MQRIPACCVPETHIEIDGLEVSYAGVPAVRVGSMPIYRGCVTAIVGPSGCGKSSFLASINRMTESVPGCRVSGSVRIDGVESGGDRRRLRSLRRRVGMIFQRPNPLPVSIAANIEAPLKDHGVGQKAERRRRAEQALRTVGLWEEVADRLHKPALSLSGGQQQRLCLARCLALEPEVVLLDEPCSSLDPMATDVVEQALARLRGRYTTVIVTHNLAQARRIADFTGVFWQLGRGREDSLVEFGSTRRVFETPAEELTSMYIGGAQG